ncbi:SDR family oxidoreductase [Sneathiella chinensis]|uniref:Short chain dehydrogenase n=1 Tax=Sneathiella chinensis TaxID=349750 RepID=A0ABQ5U4Y0_9PROT|nr:SDR family oxidoreductase [Sneathiella chinensis]GLQ06250.1 short chain dehydrogenase [Sneathiella chinensis]
MTKNALVTGAGKRIGRAIALKLAQEGWNIALHYNQSRQEAQDLARQIEALGVRTTCLQADLASPEQVAALIPQAADHLGPLTCLVNNASLFEPDDIGSIGPDSFRLHMAINLEAPVLLSRDFASQIEQAAPLQGNIINIVDQRVMNLRPDFMSYTLSKSALWTLTRTTAMALAPRIRVNAIGPGPTLANSRQSEESFRLQCQSVPLGYGANPDDIAEGVAFILKATSMTGEFIALDGGQHLPSSRATED